MEKNVVVSSIFDENSQVVLAEIDCLEFLRKMPQNVVKLVVTSPPYNIGKTYELKQSLEEYLQSQKQVIEAMSTVLKPDGSVCWQVGNYVKDGQVFPLDCYFYHLFMDLGFKLRNRIIWYFAHGLHSKNRLSGRYETVLWFTKSDTYTFNLDPIRVPSKYPGKCYYKGEKKGQPSCNPKGKNPSDVWQIVCQDWENEIWEIPNVKANHPEKTKHPCQFPIELVERCILPLTDEEDWVLDPFGGVGSTVIAALKNNRRVISIDRESEYIEITKHRILQFVQKSLPIRPLGKPIHQPSGKVATRPDQWEKT